MQIGSQHVSYHAGQRTFIMLHAGPQTGVKEDFLYLTMAMKSRMFQSLFFSYRKKNLLPLYPKFQLFSRQSQRRNMVEFIK